MGIISSPRSFCTRGTYSTQLRGMVYMERERLGNLVKVCWCARIMTALSFVCWLEGLKGSDHSKAGPLVNTALDQGSVKELTRYNMVDSSWFIFLYTTFVKFF